MPARGQPGYDRLYKIKPILEYLNERFQQLYEPRNAICVDESLLLFKGRLVFKQFIRLKRARFGIKIYLCCESDGGVQGGGGYCYRFKVYCGKDDPVNEITPALRAADALNPSLTISENMVVYMILPLLRKGYCVYTDNWYTSLRLYLYLLEKRTLACGTLRENRGVPADLVNTQLVKGASAAV